MKTESVEIVFPVPGRVAVTEDQRADELYRALPDVDSGPFELTIILPMYNVERYVEQAVASIFDQGGLKYQLILVDDGSTDSSLSVVTRFLKSRDSSHAIVVRQENRGLSAARNLGLRFAVGTYLAFLDTDDFMVPSAYSAIVQFGLKRSLDLVLFRSYLFDAGRGGFADFYDAKTWKGLLNTEPRRVTCVAEEPALLSLEPNANTRIVRRDLIDRAKVCFPEGLHFEDQPIHATLLLRARRVGLVGAPLYCYRINRPGKITDQRSRRRFDMLDSFSLTIAAAKRYSASPCEGAQLLRGLLRISYWCGTMTSLQDRREYFAQLCERYAEVPREWLDRFRDDHRQQLQTLLTHWAIRSNKVDFLCKMSFGQKPLYEILNFFISERRLAALVYQAISVLRRRIATDT